MMQTDVRPLMVSIRCIVYNHEPFLRQCLEGFVMQKTNFRFEAIVHDDASTDNSAAIIQEYAKKYPDIIKPIIETENQYSKRDGSLRRIMSEACTGKYVAICEGDDYWTDPLKLQKQVDYLEAHPSCTLVHSNFSYFIENKKLKYVDESQNGYNSNADEADRIQIMKDMLNNNKYRVTTGTAMYRNSTFRIVQKEMPLIFSPHFLMGDTQLWVALVSKGDVHYFTEPMSVYRKHVGSATFAKKSQQHLRFRLSAAEMRYYLSTLIKELNVESLKYEKKLEEELSRYIPFNPNYTSFVIESIKDIHFGESKCRFLKKSGVTRFLIRSYYELFDFMRLVYRTLKQKK